MSEDDDELIATARTIGEAKDKRARLRQGMAAEGHEPELLIGLVPRAMRATVKGRTVGDDAEPWGIWYRRVRWAWCHQAIEQDADGWWLLAGQEPDAECDDYACPASPRGSHDPEGKDS